VAAGATGGRDAAAGAGTPFAALTPDAVLDAAEAIGLDPAQMQALDDALAAAPATQPDDRSSPEGTIEVGLAESGRWHD